jgi:hypothetical protein
MKKLLAAFVLVATLISCDDEETFETISFAIPANFERSTQQRWIFISDLNGNVLDVAEVENNSILSLSVSSGASKPLAANFFTLDAFSSTEKVRHLNSYIGITPGEYSIDEPYIVPSTLPEFKVSLQNFEAYQYASLSGDVQVLSSSTNDQLVALAYLRGKAYSKALISTLDVENGERRYKMFDAYPDETYIIDYTDLPSFTKTTFSVPDGTPSIEQYGYKDDTKMMINSTSSLVSGTGNTVNFFAANIFDSYFTTATVQQGAVYNYNDYYGTQVPTQFTLLNASANLVAQNDDGFTINTTGNADVLQTGFFAGEVVNGVNFTDRRYIFFPFEQTINYKHPKLPEEILSRYFPNGANIGGLGGATITDLETMDHAGFLKYRISVDNPFVAVKANARRKFLQF